MKTKPKLVICALIFFIGGMLNLFFSTALDGLLSHKITKLSFPPLTECLSSLVSSRQHFLLFLCIQGFFLLLAVLFFTTNLYPYKSDLDQVTPEIQTPKAVGQYQHGSARWLTEAEKNTNFNSFLIDPEDNLIKSLIESGYDGIEFIRQ